MTCIVGMVHAGGVTLGGDSAGIGGYDLVVRKDPKVFALDGGRAVFGFTSSFRMGDLLRYRLDFPKRHPDVDLDRWMRTDFIDAVRHCLKAGGYAGVSNGVETGGDFLVGLEGRLFRIASDFQVGESACGLDAVGCGESFAIGAMHALRGAGVGPADLSFDAARYQVGRALAIAEACSAGVRAPFTYATAHGPALRAEPPFAG